MGKIKGQKDGHSDGNCHPCSVVKKLINNQIKTFEKTQEFLPNTTWETLFGAK